MQKLLQVDFDFTVPFGDEMSAMMVGLAKSINHEPGMVWKIWTENKTEKLGGGIYLFENEAYAQAYLAMHTARLHSMGITDVRGYIFDINMPLSTINHAPITKTA